MAVEPLGRIRVRVLGGDEVIVIADVLARPHDPDALDGRGTRHWTTKRPWTSADLRELRLVWGRESAALVAARLGRSELACELAMYRWWGQKAQRVEDRLSIRGAAAVLGVDQHRVRRLIAAGLLRGKPSGIRSAATWRWIILADDLELFLTAHPEHYDPDRITTGPYRVVAERVRSIDPVLTVAEAAERCFVDRTTIVRHIARGWLAATWAGLGRRSRGTWGWRIRQSALASFQAYPAASRRRSPRIDLSDQMAVAS